MKDPSDSAISFMARVEEIKDKIELFKENLVQQVLSKLPANVVEFLQGLAEKIQSALPSVQVGVASFVAGAFIMLAAILLPVYNQVETLTEPVTLFETILSDLERGYVDQVDTNKLFETGISAMLRSLDPYTEFEAKQQAVELSESIDGKYGGVGLVISGASPRDIALMKKSSPAATPISPTKAGSKLLPQEALDDAAKLNNNEDDPSITSTSTPANDIAAVNVMDEEDYDDDEEEDLQDRIERQRAVQKAQDRGIRVVSAFEGYAFDYGMRVGDKLLAVDDIVITPETSVDQVRNTLRGTPGTSVTIAFERDGVEGVQTVTMPRTLVQIRDVKVAMLVGKPQDGIGYIQLSGFASDAGREVRNAIWHLERAAEESSSGRNHLQGLILDLRGNPGGLLTSAVDVASLLVPKGSDIVSAKGRGFPGVLYRSRSDPILHPSTKLAVLVNGNTASAAEIVSGAVQDLDAGVIVGSDRTFGKGLVQNVEDLPFDTALKFTVAKYYTPSGRCIQGITYKEGGGLREEDGRYHAKKVSDEERGSFLTRRGRLVKDGGGIEADYKVEAPKASALEIILLRSGIFSDFAAHWSRAHELADNFEVDEDTYKEFQAFVNQKQRSGDVKLEALYSAPLNDLKRALKQSGYRGSSKELDQLQTTIVREVQKDFDKYRNDIKEDISQSILARYLPESMLIARGVKTDRQVQEAVRLVSNPSKFDRLLSKGGMDEHHVQQQYQQTAQASTGSTSSMNTASNDKEEGALLQVKW
jgi:carboxyl-terminal processing protease